MHWDKKTLIDFAQGPATKEGLIYFKSKEAGFKEKYFKLRGNLLFYYNSKGVPAKTDEPNGMMLMENFMVIKDHENLPNTFTLTDPELKNVFFCMNSRQSKEWFDVLSTISYRQQRIHLNSLRSQIKEITGTDPLEYTCWSKKC